MFNRYEPNVNATIVFLKLLKVKVNSSTVNETMQNHPDWPSLLCVTDSFNKWNISNGVGKIAPDQIDQLPVPFMVYTNNIEYPLSVVTGVSGTTVHLLSNNYNKSVIKTKEDFIKSWRGVYLIAEPTQHSGEKDFELNKRKAFVSSLIPLSLFVLLLTLSSVFLYNNIIQNTPVFSITGIYLQYILLLAGTVVTSLLLWYEIDKNNPLLQKVCTGIAKGDCNAILTGRQAKVFNWLSWSEVGFFYFTGGLLLLVTLTKEESVTLLSWLNILALPYTVFSIYYQWKVAKQWCLLCLAVQALLLLGAANIFANHFLTYPLVLSTPFLIKAALLYTLPVLLWYTVKSVILRLQEAKNTKREYLRIKFNSEIFETVLKKQKKLTVSAEGLGIDLGNNNASNTLIKVCSPTCAPCGKAHPEIDKLLDAIPNLSVKIIFTTPNQQDHPAYKPASHLLAISETNDADKLRQALDDWYLSNEKNYEKFSVKYPLTSELNKQGNKLGKMEKWCKEADIQGTPTFFINSYQLPGAYGIGDLKYFFSE